MISALGQQGGPSHLWNGARRSYLSETWSTRQRGPAVVKSGQDPGAFDGSESQPLSGGFPPENTFSILIGIPDYRMPEARSAPSQYLVRDRH